MLEAQNKELQRLSREISAVVANTGSSLAQVARARNAAAKIGTAVQKARALSSGDGPRHTLKKLAQEVAKGMRFYAAARARGITTIPVYPTVEHVNACIVKNYRKFNKEKRAGYTFQIYDPTGSGEIHHAFLYVKGQKKIPDMKTTGYALVTCSCEFYKYTCEAGLHHHGYAEMLYANSKLAPETNPNLKPVLCKHLLRAIQTVHAKGL